ncbi:NAD(P)-dependent alcohol dehydrogenase [Pendulispora albinea]|uniref:NAD(P)-dependent alcohol dehydrogenase n=1 Tax=Pendulispora albinea TaxID=2741071 RepID=A0ABZ2M460_9BACT
MKAWIIDGKFGFDALKIVERETPKPRRGEVLVRVRAASLNYRDLTFVEGNANPDHPLPLIPVADGAGEVAAVGEGVTRAKVGDRVTWTFASWLGGRPTTTNMFDATPGGLYVLGLGRPPTQGALAEYAVFDQERIVHIPEHLSFEEASTLPIAGVTAWHALFGEHPVRSGDTVLVQGTGGVATFAIQLARAAGARVIVTSSSDEKLARAREIGAHEGINYKKTPAWDQRALELTDGRGVDVVVDVSGAELGRSVNALRVDGQVSVIGFLSGFAAQVDILPLLMKNARIQGIFVGPRDWFEDLNSALVRHRIHPIIDRTYPFEKAAEAIAQLRSGNYVGKLVIKGV